MIYFQLHNQSAAFFHKTALDTQKDRLLYCTLYFWFRNLRPLTYSLGPGTSDRQTARQADRQTDRQIWLVPDSSGHNPHLLIYSPGPDALESSPVRREVCWILSSPLSPSPVSPSPTFSHSVSLLIISLPGLQESPQHLRKYKWKKTGVKEYSMNEWNY